MNDAYCSACGTVVADLESNHHVCVPDGKNGFVRTTRDEAAKANDRANRDGIAVHEALALDQADAAAAAKPPS
jgi:hypothetical protein